MKKLPVIGLILMMLVAFSALSANIQGQLNLRDGSNVRGNLTFDGEDFNIGGENISREDARKIFFGDVKTAGTDTREEFQWTEKRWNEYRRLAVEMEEAEPSANGLIFYDYSRQTLTSDGRILREYHFAGKVLTQDSKWWGTQAWYIDEGINRIEILYARSISPDGTVHEYSPDDITFSEPTRGEVFFGQGTAMSLTIPAVDIGSIVEYGYIDEEYDPEDPELFQPRFFFQSSEPAKLSKCEFEVPSDRKLYYEAFLLDTKDPYIGQTIKELPKFVGAAEPVITRTDSSTVYTWELKDIEPMVRESNSMGYYTTSPCIHASLYPDYSYYNERFGKIESEHIKITPQIDSLARAIVGDLEGEEDKIAAIYHWVQRNIRYISVKGALASRFSGHYAQITLDNKYGDCTDKAILFSTLLKVVGVESYPITVMTNDEGFLDRSRFNFWGGNHAINEVWWGGKPHILDATGNLFRFPTYSMGDCDLHYANYIRGEIVYNPPIPPEQNSMQSVTKVELRPDGSVTVDDSMWFTGEMEAGYRGYFEYMPEQRHEMIVEQFASQRKAGARLNSFALSNIRDISLPFILEFSYDLDYYPIEAGNYLLLEVPALGYYFPEIELSDPNLGKTTGETFMRTHDVTFTLADNFKVRFIPDKFELSNDYFDYTADYQVEGNTIRFTDKFRKKKLRIPISDYAKYKSDAEKIMTYIKERIFLAEE